MTIPKSLRVVAALAVALLALNWLRDERWTKASLEFAPAARRNLMSTIDAIGVLEAHRVALIKAEVTESIASRAAQEGQKVDAGQLLAELTQKNTLVEFDQKKNAFKNAGSDLRKAKKDYKIEAQLFKSQAVALSKVEEAKRALERAEASFEVVAQEFKLAQEKLSKTTVRSPIAGIVLKDHTIGKDQVRPDQDLYLIGDVSRFLIRAKVDELDAPRVRPGQPVVIDLDSYPGQSFAGTVASVAVQAEREGFAKVEVIIGVNEGAAVPLKHNLSAQVHIQVDARNDVLAIPLAAVRRKNGSDWVVIRGAGGRLAHRWIKVGQTTRQDAEVLSGLKAGEQVAVPVEARDKPRS